MTKPQRELLEPVMDAFKGIVLSSYMASPGLELANAFELTENGGSPAFVDHGNAISRRTISSSWCATVANLAIAVVIYIRRTRRRRATRRSGAIYRRLHAGFSWASHHVSSRFSRHVQTPSRHGRYACHGLMADAARYLALRGVFPIFCCSA